MSARKKAHKKQWNPVKPQRKKVAAKRHKKVSKKVKTKRVVKNGTASLLEPPPETAQEDWYPQAQREL